MGIYLNPDNNGFKKVLAADIYVDKSMLISELNKFIDKGNQYVCVSRPRRFGKSLLSSTLESYFLGEKELFEGLKIMELEKQVMLSSS